MTYQPVMINQVFWRNYRIGQRWVTLQEPCEVKSAKQRRQIVATGPPEHAMYCLVTCLGIRFSHIDLAYHEEVPKNLLQADPALFCERP